MVPLQSVPRSSLVEAVEDRLRHVVEQGQLQPGDRLPTESELAVQLGVSRTVLREAVGRLETIGVLTVRRGRGTFVGDRSSLKNCVKLVTSAMAISPKELLKFLELRSAIEYYAVRKAAETASDEQVAELQAACHGIDAEGHDDLEAMHRDLGFHLKLVEFTGNELMHNVMEVIQRFALAGMVQTTPTPRDRADSRCRHGAIVAAIRAHNPVAAEDAMRAHMNGTRRRLEQRLKHPALPPNGDTLEPSVQRPARRRNRG
jgi:GntR family transcriptional repressor for pyruvate dehydrogenase complex